MQNWQRPKSDAFSSEENFEYSALLRGIFLSAGVSRHCSLGCCHSIHHPAPPLFLQSALLSGQREATLNSAPLPSDTPDLPWCRRWHAAFLWGTLFLWEGGIWVGWAGSGSHSCHVALCGYEVQIVLPWSVNIWNTEGHCGTLVVVVVVPPAGNTSTETFSLKPLFFLFQIY